MSSGGDDPKQRVADYYLSIHYGVAHQVDAIDAIMVGDRLAWDEGAEFNGGNPTVTIDNPELFGGVKKEGGVQGHMHILFGNEDQLMPEPLAARLGRTSATCPGFRGITSLFFTGGGSPTASFDGFGSGLFSSLLNLAGRYLQAGFYWSSNTPYIKPVSVKCRRVPKLQGFEQWASIVGDRSKANSYYFHIDGNHNTGSGTEDWHAKVIREVLLQLKATVEAGARLDIMVTQTASYSTIQSKGFVNITAAQIEELRAFVYDPPAYQTTSIAWVDSMSRANLWFAQTVSDAAVGRRTFLIFGGHPDWQGGNPYSSGYPEAEDMLTRDGGLFNRTDGTMVDVFAFCPGDPTEYQLLGVFDNTAEDGAPCELSGDYGSDSYMDMAKTAVYSALFVRSGMTVNPAHIILECLLNNDWGRGIPISKVDLDSFQAAAETLFLEGLGLAMIWTGQAPIESFINEVLAHIDGKYGIDPLTGKFYITLIRGGYDTSTLFELTPDNCLVTKMQRKSLSETTNEVVVTYTNPENEGEVTVSVHDNANYAAQGALVSSSVNYYGVRSPELAMRLAQRELIKMSAPLASFDIEVNREAWHLKSGDVVKITYPEYGLVGLPIRVMSTTSGKPGDMRITLNALEDVFEMPGRAYVVPSGSKWQDSSKWPTELQRVLIATAPYYLTAVTAGDAAASGAIEPAAGVMVLGAQNNSDTRSFDLYDSHVDATGAAYWRAIKTMFQAGWVSTAEQLALEATSVIDEYANFAGDVYPTAGTLVWLGSDPLTCELALVTNVDAQGVHLARGLLDTVPRKWPVGTPMWLLGGQRSYLDPVERVDGTPVTYRLCPTTSLGTLPAGSAISRPVTPDDRHYCPYRPANVKINTVLWPDQVSPPNIAVTWSRRNRLLENPVPVSWIAADVAPEDGTTFTVQLYRVDTNALLQETTGITGTSITLPEAYDGEVRLELFAVRGGKESYQRFIHQFWYSSTEYRITTDGQARLTTDGQVRTLS